MALNSARDFIWNAWPFMFMAGLGFYLLLFARRSVDWEIRGLQRRWTVPFYRAIGAFWLLMAVVVVWVSIQNGIVLLDAVWVLGAASIGLFGLLFARRYRDWEIRQLQRRSQVPAMRILGAFCLLIVVFVAWASGFSFWR